MSENKKTCLYDNHVKQGALISPFGGFEMPIRYTDIKDEHLAVRQNVGVFDVSHMGEVEITGPDAEKFVQHLFTNDVSGAEPGKIFYGMMLYPDGGCVDDLLVYCEGDGKFFLVINAANIDKDVEWINTNAKGFDVVVDHQSDYYGQIAVQGPKSEATLKEVLDLDAADLTFYTFKKIEICGETIIVSRTGYTGEDGFEIYGSHSYIVACWEKLMSAGVKPCGLGCRDTLRF
ncbi:MAG: glycine cleavage system aminomethyltransferase GcvT, partial [Bacteroidaceae bacterium]